MARAGVGEGGAAVFPGVAGVQSGRAFRASAIRRAFGPRGVYEFRPRLDVEHEWFLVSAISFWMFLCPSGSSMPPAMEASLPNTPASACHAILVLPSTGERSNPAPMVIWLPTA